MAELPNAMLPDNHTIQPVNPSHVTLNELVHYITHNSLVDNSYIRHCICYIHSLGNYTA